MYLIVGLGNPEPEYSNTRHNMGFNVVNKIAQEYQISLDKSKFNGLYGKGIIENEKIVIIKPQTYMNLSGESIVQFANFYKVEMDTIIVVYDDIDTEPGKIRVRRSGSAGTHNGMKSIVSCLNTEDFPRVRVGIGMSQHKHDLMNYVIGHINKEEKEELSKGIDLAKYAIVEILRNGIDTAMNKFN